MIFRQELIDKILAGEKTVTRRPAKRKRGVAYGPAFQPCHYKPGKEYAVQPGRGKKGVARIRIKRVNLEALGIIDQGEVEDEGFEKLAQFEGYWRWLYGNFDPMQLVHRIEFELV